MLLSIGYRRPLFSIIYNTSLNCSRKRTFANTGIGREIRWLSTRNYGAVVEDSVNQLQEECRFDEFVEKICEPFYVKTLGRPGLAPGIYFRVLMVGYFEGIDSEGGSRRVIPMSI
jgi:hypothetical protein